MKKNRRLIIYFSNAKVKDRFVWGDRFIIDWIKRLIKGKKTSGVEKVFKNLCKSFDYLNVAYKTNLPFKKILPGDQLIVLGGSHVLDGYQKENKIVAGIALMTHPSEWPDLCKQYPIAKYLQHSDWAKNTYVPYFGEKICDTWFAGIDTEKWKPKVTPKKFDVLVYNKIRWEYEHYNKVLRNPVIETLKKKGLSYKEVIYGAYREKDYRKLLSQCKAMIFLCEHESQGFACCEALSMNIPIMAWDQGFCLDPNRFTWNDPIMPATSVPFHTANCGMRFKDADEFSKTFDHFIQNVNERKYHPRNYITNNLTLQDSGNRMISILEEVYR